VSSKDGEHDDDLAQGREGETGRFCSEPKLKMDCASSSIEFPWEMEGLREAENRRLRLGRDELLPRLCSECGDFPPGLEGIGNVLGGRLIIGKGWSFG
jgi:hypothetical protein